MVARHYDTLAQYGAGAVRIVPHEGDPEDFVVAGGGLADAFERIGQRPLLGVLVDPEVDEVLMADGELSVEARREGEQVRLRVAFGQDVVVDDLVELPATRGQRPGPWFRPDPDTRLDDVLEALYDIGRPVHVVSGAEDSVSEWFAGGLHGPGLGARRLRGTIPAVFPEDLGSVAFRRAHGVRWAYVAGAMAGGIASADLVLSMAREGLLSFFGAGGLSLALVETALRRIATEAPAGAAWGANLLHNPNEPAVEERTVDLYNKYKVRRVSASAYMGLTPAVVRYRVTGIHRDSSGAIVTPNKVFAKVSRPEVAEHFLRPPPAALLDELVKRGAIAPEQAELALQVPVAEDITAEADSGGHTDRRPLLALLPILQRLRDTISREEDYATRGISVRVGAAGGLGTPAALWAAFSMGADYVLTGSVNQASVEAGTSRTAKSMLCQAQFYDVTTGPAPDMFELGAHVQVLSRGTMYARRAQRLYDIYKRYDSMEAIPPDERKKLESQLFKDSLDTVWERTRAYWTDRDPEQVARADRDPRHKLALTFRWYLGMTSRWARTGTADRKRDYQVWCGPAMGAFNAWVTGTRLEALDHRRAPLIAEALMNGAAGHARLTMARALGLQLPVGADDVPVMLIDHTDS